MKRVNVFVALLVTVSQLGCVRGNSGLQGGGASATADWRSIAWKYVEQISVMFDHPADSGSAFAKASALENELAALPPPAAPVELEMLSARDPSTRLMALAAVYVAPRTEDVVLAQVACHYDGRSPLAERFLAAHAMGQHGAGIVQTCPNQVVDGFAKEEVGVFIAAAFPALDRLDARAKVSLAVEWFVGGNLEVRTLAYLLVRPLGQKGLDGLRDSLIARGATGALNALAAIEAKADDRDPSDSQDHGPGRN